MLMVLLQVNGVGDAMVPEPGAEVDPEAWFRIVRLMSWAESARTMNAFFL